MQVIRNESFRWVFHFENDDDEVNIGVEGCKKLFDAVERNKGIEILLSLERCELFGLKEAFEIADFLSAVK